jgi:glycosyltransferase involved in cell wall biosynthesis
MSAPRVAVVIPAWRAAGTVGAAVRSVLAQTVPELELLVVDDASGDGTADAARAAAAADPRVRILAVPHGGPARARNAGIAAARTEVLAFLDADDTWAPEHLASLLPVLEAHPRRFVYGSATITGDGPDRPFHEVGYVPATSFRDLYLVPHVPSPGAVLVRREDVLAAGGFLEDPAVVGSEDRALWLELSRLGVTPLHVPRATLSYRVHPGQLSRRGARQLLAKREVRRRFRDATDPSTGARLVPLDAANTLLGAVSFDLALALARTDEEGAHAALAEAVAADPTILADGRLARFEAKARRARWVSLPEPVLPLGRLGALVATTWAAAAIGLYVAARFLARGSGGG